MNGSQMDADKKLISSVQQPERNQKKVKKIIWGRGSKAGN